MKEVKFQEGDVVRKKNGQKFANGRYTSTVSEVKHTHIPHVENVIWLKEAGTNVEEKYLELAEIYKGGYSKFEIGEFIKRVDRLPFPTGNTIAQVKEIDFAENPNNNLILIDNGFSVLEANVRLADKPVKDREVNTMNKNTEENDMNITLQYLQALSDDLGSKAEVIQYGIRELNSKLQNFQYELNEIFDSRSKINEVIGTIEKLSSSED